MRKLKSTKGISIIELLVAFSLIGIAIFGVAGFLQSASFKNQSSKIETVGATLAERTLEEQKNIGYANVTNGNDTLTVEGVPYARNWTVSSVTNADVGTNRLKRVNVVVSWGNGAERQVQAATYIARPK